MTGRRVERGAARWSEAQVDVVTTDGTPFNVRGQRDLGHIGAVSYTHLTLPTKA